MKTFEITLKDCALYTIEAETIEEAIFQALEWFNERKPEIVCEIVEEDE